jgi:hypothetical protein
LVKERPAGSVFSPFAAVLADPVDQAGRPSAPHREGEFEVVRPHRRGGGRANPGIYPGIYETLNHGTSFFLNGVYIGNIYRIECRSIGRAPIAAAWLRFDKGASWSESVGGRPAPDAGRLDAQASSTHSSGG